MAAVVAALLLSACFAWTCRRASLESTVWADELFSLTLAVQSPARIVELTAADFHPPGYYLALKVWLKLGRLTGGEPGILWARGLNILLWTLLAAGTWIGGRRLLGSGGGALLAAAVCGSAAATQWAIDLRGYAPVFVASVLGLLLLVIDLVEVDRGSRPRLWTSYGLLAATALWCHLLAIPLFALLTMGWGAWRLIQHRQQGWRGLLPGVGAALGALALSLPWLLRATAQAAALRATHPVWMTPTSVRNLGSVFLYWFPFGRLTGPANPPLPGLALLGVATLIAPAVVLAESLRHRSREESLSAASALAGLGLSAASGFTCFLWLAARFEIAPVFHGPRYPLLAAGLWAAGLVGASLRGVQASQGSKLAGWLALCPWLLAAGLGQVLLGLDEPRWGLAGERQAVAAAAAEPAFAFPSELIPFFRQTLAPLRLRRIEDLPCAAKGQAAITVVNLNPWHGIDRLRDRLVARAIASGSLAGTHDARRLPEGHPFVVIHRLADLDRSSLSALCARGWTPKRPPLPRDAVAVALAEDQARRDGWSNLEISAGSLRGPLGERGGGPASLRRRGSAGSLRPSPDRRAARAAGASVELALRLDGQTEARKVMIGPGPMEIELPLAVERRLRNPLLVIRHPTWSPAAALGTSDRAHPHLLLLLRLVRAGAELILSAARPTAPSRRSPCRRRGRRSRRAGRRCGSRSCS